jgi:hypothetical protein
VKAISQALSVTRTAACEYPTVRVRYPILYLGAMCKISANDANTALAICAIWC